MIFFFFYKMNPSSFSTKKTAIFLSDDEITLEVSQKCKSRLFSLHLEKYGDRHPPSFAGLQTLLLPINSPINRTATLQHIISQLEEDSIENSQPKNIRIRSSSIGENLESLQDFHGFYYSIKRQKKQVCIYIFHWWNFVINIGLSRSTRYLKQDPWSLYKNIRAIVLYSNFLNQENCLKIV